MLDWKATSPFHPPMDEQHWAGLLYALIGDCVQDGSNPEDGHWTPYPTMWGSRHPSKLVRRGTRVYLHQDGHAKPVCCDVTEILPAVVSYAVENPYAHTIFGTTPWSAKVSSYLTEFPWLLCGANFQRFDRLTGEGVLEVVARHPELLSQTEPRQFEKLIAELLTREGWRCEVVERLNAHGVDIRAFRCSSDIVGDQSDEFMVVECKAGSGPVGINVIRSIVCSRDYEYEADRAMVACKTRFTGNARRLAHDVIPWELELRDRGAILALCRQFGILNDFYQRHGGRW